MTDPTSNEQDATSSKLFTELCSYGEGATRGWTDEERAQHIVYRAAYQIERLTLEFRLSSRQAAALRDERDRLIRDHQQYVEWASPQLERLGREMADNERLRAALELIAGTNGTECATPRVVAAKALSGDSPPVCTAHIRDGSREGLHIHCGAQREIVKYHLQPLAILCTIISTVDALPPGASQIHRGSEIEMDKCKYLKVCPRGFANEVIYFRVPLDKVSEAEASEYFDLADEGQGGYAEWTTDKRASMPGVSVNWSDRHLI